MKLLIVIAVLFVSTTAHADYLDDYNRQLRENARSLQKTMRQHGNPNYNPPVQRQYQREINTNIQRIYQGINAQGASPYNKKYR